jgi:hypothetical protein
MRTNIVIDEKLMWDALRASWLTNPRLPTISPHRVQVALPSQLAAKLANPLMPFRRSNVRSERLGGSLPGKLGHELLAVT